MFSWNTSSQPSFFFHHLVPHVCPSIWHIENSRTLLWNPRSQDTLKKVICMSILQTLFLLLCHFHMDLNIQNSWPKWLSTYCWQFSTGTHFHLNWSTNHISSFSTIPCRVLQQNFKHFPCYGQEQEQLVNIAPKFSLLASGQLQNRYALQTSILRTFRDHLVNPQNPTEIMSHRVIRVEHCLCSIRRSI